MILPLPKAKGLPSAVFALSLNSAICNSSYNSSKSMPVISPLLSFEKRYLIHRHCLRHSVLLVSKDCLVTFEAVCVNQLRH